jgi:hypothetical protein
LKLADSNLALRVRHGAGGGSATGHNFALPVFELPNQLAFLVRVNQRVPVLSLLKTGGTLRAISLAVLKIS